MGYLIHTLDPRTWLIEEEAPECNVYMYLLAGEKEAVLIDSGYGTIPLDELTASLTALPVTVLCTHGHFDHIGGVSFFSNIRMHRADRTLYQQHRLEVRKIAPGCIAPEAPQELQWFDGPITLELGDRTLKVFPVPGHTGGCVVILDVERRQLFTGDTCCKGPVLLNFDDSTDLVTYHSSIRFILDMQEHYHTTWPAHHAKPLGTEIPRQFLEAAELLITGQAQGSADPDSGSTDKRFPYKDISIIY